MGPDKALNHAIKSARTMLKSAENSLIGRPSRIYVMQLHTNQNAYGCLFKIGQSIEPSRRVIELSRRERYPITIVTQFPTDHADLAEYRLHVAYEHLRIQDEWFALNREILEWLVNTAKFVRGEYYAYSQRIILPRNYWDGVVDLPF